jgi:prepilin-type N-terminal cleavage/methylation domain-containing protein
MIITEPKKTGFTLIELLVVIAIIGILASVVLVSLGNVRNRAKDVRIKAEMSQIRTISDLFKGNSESYTSLCDTSTDIATLKTDIESQGGTNFKCYDSVNAYCVEVKMNTPDYWWCVDSEYSSEPSASDPATCGSGTYTCH